MSVFLIYILALQTGLAEPPVGEHGMHGVLVLTDVEIMAL